MSKYIESVIIQNFQSHPDSTFDLDKGLNAFIGPSGHGKSAIIKALEWVLFNKVVGERPNSNIHSKWIKKTTAKGNISFKGETTVTLKLTDGTIVSRIKGKESRYEVTLPGKEPVTYTGNGQNVPEEVTNIFKFTDLNLESQADSYFMVFDSPSQIAKRLADVCDLSLGDKVLSKIKSETRSVNSTVKVTTEDITEIEKSLEEFSDLEKMEEELELVVSLYEKFQGLKDSFKECSEQVETFQSLKRQLDSVGDIEGELNALNDLEEKQKHIGDDIHPQLISAQSYIGDYKYLDNEIKKGNTELASEVFLDVLNNIGEKVSVKEKELSEISESLAKFKELSEESKTLPNPEEITEVDKLLVISDNIKTLSRNHIDIKGSLETFKANITKDRDLAEELKALEADLKDVLEGECPLCGRSA